MTDVTAQLAEIAKELPQETVEEIEPQETVEEEFDEGTIEETAETQEIVEEAAEPTDINDISSLAAAIEVEPEFLYNLEVGMGENLAPIKLGELKDQYQLARRRVTEMETQLTEANKELQQAQTQQQGMGTMSQEMLNAMGRMSAIQQQFNETNWTELEADDQVNAMLTRQKLNDAYSQAQAQYSQLEQQSKQQAEEQRRQAIAKSQQSLLNAIPSWADEATAKKEIAEIKVFAGSMGYSDQDINNVTDHRALLVLRDAMLYRKLLSQKTEAVKQVSKAPKVLKAAGRRKGKVGNVDQLIQRARKSGTQSDQTAALRSLFQEQNHGS